MKSYFAVGLAILSLSSCVMASKPPAKSKPVEREYSHFLCRDEGGNEALYYDFDNKTFTAYGHTEKVIDAWDDKPRKMVFMASDSFINKRGVLVHIILSLNETNHQYYVSVSNAVNYETLMAEPVKCTVFYK